MPPPPPPTNILEVFKSAKDAISSQINPIGLTLKSCGTKVMALAEPTNVSSGYWQNPQTVSSKPPRWIVQFTENPGTPRATARLAVDSSGAPFSSAATIGYINNRDGSCAVTAFRIFASVMPGAGTSYVIPDWEWLLILAFPSPLPQGTSGDALSDFEPATSSVSYGSGGTRRNYVAPLVAIVTAPCPPAPSLAIAYSDATAALEALLIRPGNRGRGVYDGTSLPDMQSLATEIRALVTPATPTLPANIVSPNTTLLGLPQSVYRQINAALASGKRHFILYGPPGTVKTTLAEYIARELSDDPASNDSYVMLTASSSWSNQDLVGGYQPLGPGAMGFIPGAMLRHFDKPIVIDELNRCPIDKVVGPLFSVLSGQSTTLPYRVNVGDPGSDFFVILPADRAGRSPHEFAPTPFWRLVCTLNTVDKTQLGQISYALSRRFAWIRVGVPDDLASFTRQIAGLLFPGARTPASSDPSPIADMWASVNQVRELGGAPIIDMMKAAMHIYPALDLFAPASSSTAQDALLDAFQMNLLPMLDGISTRQATDLAAQIGLHWSLPVRSQDELRRDLLELAI